MDDDSTVDEFDGGKEGQGGSGPGPGPPLPAGDGLGQGTDRPVGWLCSRLGGAGRGDTADGDGPNINLNM